ncbi:MAG: hypothetical protein V3V08_03220 [Nannocystaceae bacterium]
MAMGSQDWIQESLTRLEQLEQARDEQEARLEAANDADTLRALSETIDAHDEEIRRLYATLEAVAETDGEQEPAQNPPDAATNEFQRAAVDAPAPLNAGNPLNPQPHTHAPQTLSSATTPDFGSSMDADFDDDISSGGSKGKWLLAGLAVAAVVSGIAFTQTGGSGAVVATAPPVHGPVLQVIKATAVPLDTQEPTSAVGADVTKTPVNEYKPRSKSKHRSSPRSKKKRRAPRPQPEEKGRKISVGKGGDDPFG